MQEQSTERMGQVLAEALASAVKGNARDWSSGELLYYGDESLDAGSSIGQVVEAFLPIYEDRIYTQPVKRTKNPYVDSLNEQKHKCTSFTKLCRGEAKRVPL
jgi:hypothetical protein